MRLFGLSFIGLAGVLLSLNGCSSGDETSNSLQESAQEETKNAQAETTSAKAETKRPNILLIVADDLGYTDLGVYGGEISTPNLDQLARDGMILTDFHNQAVCSPTRAALMAGTDSHNAGGAMHVYESQKGTIGYVEGLRPDVVSFPKILSANGYRTYFAGKWHLGSEPERRPIARGFDRTLALMPGGASHYSDMKSMFSFEPPKVAYTQNGEILESLPEDFYSTTNYTDFIISAIEEGKDIGCLLYTSPSPRD